MKKLNQILLLLIASLTMSSGCKKDKQPNTAANLNNQLICKIDGAEWKSKEVIGRFYDNTNNQGGKYLYFLFSSGTQHFDLIVNSPYKSGTVVFNQITTPYPNSLSPKDYVAFVKGYSDLTPEEQYITNAVDNGSINFSMMDTINKKVKATFSFTGKDSRTGKKVIVTEGYLEYHQ
jgi:hypothetical protein